MSWSHLLLSDEEAAALLAPEAFVADMIRIEAALAEAGAEVGLVPEAAAAQIAAALGGLTIAPARLAEGTAAAGVPVPALLGELRAAVPEAADWLHYGATSQDIMDNALLLQLGPVLALFEARLAALLGALQAQAEANAEVLMAGRTRAQVSTPITFGLRIARWAQPLTGAEAELPALKARLMRVQLGGASGSGGAVAPQGPALAAALARRLGLATGPAWHTDRSALAALAGWAARLSAGLAKMAGDLLLMGRSEAGEARAGAGGGSSTMPQKANPVTEEAILALHRHIAALAPVLSQPHAEERDGAAWAAEWLTLPPLLISLAAALGHSLRLAETLRPDPAAMARRFDGAALLAEAAVYALLPHLGRAEAEALTRWAAGQGDDMIAALQRLTEAPVDWAALTPEAALAPCRAEVAAIFAARR